MNLKLKMRLRTPTARQEQSPGVPEEHRRLMLVVASAEDLDTGEVIYECCHLWALHEMAKNEVVSWASKMGHVIYAAKDHVSPFLSAVRSLLVAGVAHREKRLGPVLTSEG